MMKVSNVNRRADSRSIPARGHDWRGVTEVEAPLFRRTLNEMSQEMYTARLLQMKKSIDDQAQRLSDKVDVKEYEKYRRLIREFLDEIVSNGYTFSRENTFASHGSRHRYIATVETINDKLAELGKEVMREQADKIDILSKIDDIRGLLLDLMM